jgi:phosphoribosylamine--glycine ligase/phosphoribosylformylglycinamidine cyclo-ligase
MKRQNIPTAAYENFTDYEKARQYLDSVSHNVVIKADGLAGGKGVIIPTTKEEAHQALREMMLDRQFGDAGNEVVIEEYLEGDELSVLTFSDGYSIKSLPAAQDHKRIFDGDQGPNTGGMGCYAPTPISSKQVLEEIDRTIVQPSIDGMRREGQYTALSETHIVYASEANISKRFPFRWNPIYWTDDDEERPKGP